MNKQTMKQFESEENQKVVRQTLTDWARKHKSTIRSLSSRLKISEFTLRRFLKEEKDVDFRTLCIVDAFLEKVEDEVDKV